MGGWGQREMIENMLVPKGMPIDSIVVKVGMIEAIMPMRKEIFASLPKTQELVKKAVRRAKKGQKIVIIGVGNSSGIEDNKKTVENVKKVVMELDKKYKEKEKKEKKRSWI